MRQSDGELNPNLAIKYRWLRNYRGIMWKFTMTLKTSMKGYVDD